MIASHRLSALRLLALSAICAKCTVTLEVTSKIVFSSGIPFQLTNSFAAVKVPEAISCFPPVAASASCGVWVIGQLA